MRSSNAKKCRDSSKGGTPTLFKGLRAIKDPCTFGRSPGRYGGGAERSNKGFRLRRWIEGRQALANAIWGRSPSLCCPAVNTRGPAEILPESVVRC
jgi:hypothetical protein